MITSALLYVFGFFLNGLLLLLPTATLPTEILTALTTLFNSANEFNYILPVDTLISLIGYMLIFDAALITWAGIKWILNLIRGSGA